MKNKYTLIRLILAVISMAIEQAAIWAVWRYLLPELDINLPVWVIAVIMVAWLIIGAGLYIVGTGTLKRKELPGLSSMVGVKGKAHSRLDPRGTVKIMGELWTAASENDVIESGEKIIVTGEEGLKLIVRKEK